MNWRISTGAALIGVAIAASLAVAPELVAQADQRATPSAQPPGVSIETLVRATPATVDDPRLALVRVTIAPGAQIPEHLHTGTQVAAIVDGDLTYTVFSGEVDLFRAGTNPSRDRPEVLGAGDRVVLHAGDAVAEHPGSRHQARNDGGKPVLIYLSILYPAARPPTLYMTPAASPTA